MLGTMHESRELHFPLNNTVLHTYCYGGRSWRQREAYLNLKRNLRIKLQENSQRILRDLTNQFKASDDATCEAQKIISIAKRADFRGKIGSEV
jgi:hypothetical protein